ncbi:EamA family transporter [Halobacteriales archaeon QH_7_69_31]|nr:MAG: EamA family transporter [Halobacteriales archaeon QH_7_69_31]
MSRWYATALFVTLATMWGLSFPAISVGLEYIPPLLFAAFRYDTAAVLLLGYAISTTDNWRPVGRNNQQAVLAGGLFLVAGNGLLFIGQQTVPSGVAAILQAMVPIATALWAMALLGERLSGVGSVGVALGFLGVALVVQPNPDSLLAGDTAGRLIILGQVASVSLGSVLVDRAQPSMERVPMTGWAMLVGGLVLHLLSLAAGEPVPASVAEPAAVGAVAYLGVFSTALAFIIYFTILHDRGAFEASLVAYLVPVVATVVGVAVLGETVSVLSLVGFVVVFLGFALLKRRALVDMVGAGVS